jgi:hypothetical protein
VITILQEKIVRNVYLFSTIDHGEEQQVDQQILAEHVIVTDWQTNVSSIHSCGWIPTK